MNSLAKDMRAIRRLAKAAILRDLCLESMGVVKLKKISYFLFGQYRKPACDIHGC